MLKFANTNRVLRVLEGNSSDLLPHLLFCAEEMFSSVVRCVSFIKTRICETLSNGAQYTLTNRSNQLESYYLIDKHDETCGRMLLDPFHFTPISLTGSFVRLFQNNRSSGAAKYDHLVLLNQ